MIKAPVIKETAGWVPHNGNTVFYINDDLKPKARVWNFSGGDLMRCIVGNYFEHMETAEDICKQIKKLIADANADHKGVPDIGDTYYYLDSSLRFTPRCNVGSLKDITCITSGNYIWDSSIVEIFQESIRSLFLNRNAYLAKHGTLTSRVKFTRI